MPLKVAFVSLMLTASVVACTEVDDTLGLNLIPENQEMALRFSTLNNIKTYITQVDSIPSSNIGCGMIGSQSSTIFGTTTSGALVQYTNYRFDKPDHFGKNPKADSVRLTLYITAYSSGNTDQEQTFYVYEVTKKMRQDSLYYPNFDIASAANLSTPLFSFTHKGKQLGAVSKTLKSVGDAGKNFLKKILAADTTLFSNDSLFRNEFKGFYIRPATDSPKAASIFSFDLQELESEMVIYSRSFTDPAQTDKTVKDTISQHFYFADGSSQYMSGNLSLNTVKHDYTGSKINSALFSDTLPTSATQAKIYVQGLSGVTTYLRFTDDFIKEVKGLIQDGYKELAVSKALLMIPMQEATVPYLNAAQKRLGMYFKYKGLNPAPIPDYIYTQELQGSSIPYGGYLNRGRGMYQMDITTYVQQLLTNPKLQRTVNLAPAMEQTRPLGFGEVALQGFGGDKPINIVLTYTLIK